MGKEHYTAVLVSLAITLISEVRTQASTTCTAGYYKPGDKATITCHFYGESNIATNAGVYIQWRALGAGDQSTGKEAVMCHFIGGALKACDREKGYSFVDFHNTSLTIAVDGVSAEFQGSYSCGVVTPTVSGRTVRPCLLVVEGATASDIEVRNGSQEKHKSLQRQYQATLTLFIIFLFVAAGAIVYTIFAYRRKWFPFRIPASQTEQEKLVPHVTDQSVQTENDYPDETDSFESGNDTATGEGSTEENKFKRKKSRAEKNKDKETLKVAIRVQKDILKVGASEEEKNRIDKEHDDMIARSKSASGEEKKRIREEYLELLTHLKNAPTKAEKKRIQEKYDNRNKHPAHVALDVV